MDVQPPTSRVRSFEKGRMSVCSPLATLSDSMLTNDLSHGASLFS